MSTSHADRGVARPRSQFRSQPAGAILVGLIPFALAAILLWLTAPAANGAAAYSGPKGNRPPPSLSLGAGQGAGGVFRRGIWPVPGAKTPELLLPPMLGHVGSSEARVWAASTLPATLGVAIGTSESLDDARSVVGPIVTAASGGMGHVRVTGLRPETRYFYGVTLDGRRAGPPPYPSFVTAPPEGQAGRVRFGFTSCVGNEGKLATAGYAELAGAELDLLLMLGDNTYANTNEPTVHRKFFGDQRQTDGWRRLAPETPIYAIWDDHDFGPNNSDGRMIGKDKSLQAFMDAWANPAYGETDNPGVYFKFRRRDIEFFMLDVRYHRDPNNASNLVAKTMLGSRQLDWLKRELKASNARIKILASGSEWQTNGTADSWTSFAEERDEIFRFLDENRIEGVLLLSGDRHFTAAYHVRGRWIEVTSGPLGSPAATVSNLSEMFLNFSATKGHYYCVYELDTSGSPPRVQLDVHQVGVGQPFRRTFDWEEINGQRRIPSLPPSPPAKRRRRGGGGTTR